MNVCYILRCADGTLYTGWTNDLEKRLRAHKAGKGGSYTRSRLPWSWCIGKPLKRKKKP